MTSYKIHILIQYCVYSQKQLAFYLNIAQNLSTVSYKGVSYETILSVGSYLKWVKIVNLQASQSSDNLSHFRHTQIQYLIIDWFGLSSCCFGFVRQTIQLIFLCCEFEILASRTYSMYLTLNRVLKVSLICDSPIFILGLYRMSKNTLYINRMNENVSTPDRNSSILKVSKHFILLW